MKENKSLVQEALIQMKHVEEAIAENAKGILASTMKEEINQLVKESLSEQEDEDEIDLDADVNTDADNDEMEMDIDTDMDMDSDEEEMDMDFGMDMDMDSEESPIDLTDASDEEILKVFKAMGEDDGIIVKKDGENVHLTDDDADVEYLVKLGESDYDHYRGAEKDDAEHIKDLEKDMEDDSEYTEEMDEDVNDVIDAIFDGDVSDVDSSDIEDEYEDETEVVYEITLDEDDDMEEDDMEETYDDMEVYETYKPKGEGMGKAKFSYKKTTGGFDEKMKQGPKSVGTGKAKFDYKKGENMGGKSKVVKAETKEGDYGMTYG
jgi:hypothetical protein